MAAAIQFDTPAVLHNFADYLLSDTSRKTTLCFPQVGRVQAIALTLYKLRSKFVTKAVSANQVDWNEVASRLMPVNRSLRLVLSRKPVPFMPQKHVPGYLLVYVIETLECGHELTVYPQVDALIAKRRVCPDCTGLPARKPVQSVRAGEES